MDLTVITLSPRLFRSNSTTPLPGGSPGQFNVKILVIVNVSPWGGSLGVTAWRLVRAMLAGGLEVAAVFFRDDGVYQAVPGRADDAGTPALHACWLELQRECGVPLLVCSSAAQRRLAAPPAGGFREAGLAEILELTLACDRVVTF